MNRRSIVVVICALILSGAVSLQVYKRWQRKPADNSTTPLESVLSEGTELPVKQRYYVRTGRVQKVLFRQIQLPNGHDYWLMESPGSGYRLYHDEECERCNQ